MSLSRLLPALASLCFAVPTANAAPPAAGPGAETAAAPAPEAETGPPVGQPLGLAIAGPEGDQELAEGLRSPLETMLGERGHPVTEGARNGIFVVVDVPSEARDVYEVQIRLELGDETLFFAPSRCVRCGSAALLDHIGERVDTALAQLPPDQPNGDDNAEPDSGVKEDPIEEITPPQVVPLAPDRLRLSTRGIIGAVALGTGLGAVAAGATLWARRTTDHPSRPDWELRLRPPGIALVSAGAAATITGAVLLGLDIHRARARAVSAAPLIGPGLGGVALSGRF